MISSSNKDQILALLKKNWLTNRRTRAFFFQELFGPLISIYLVYQTSHNGSSALGALAIPVYLSRSVIGLTFSVVQEKSENYKEYLRVNGASLFSYMMSTFIFYLLKALTATTIFYAGALITGSTSHDGVDILLGYVNLICYSIALINFALALTTFFSSPRLVAQISSLSILVLTYVYYPVSLSTNIIAYYAGSLLPPVAAVFGFSLSGDTTTYKAPFTSGEAVLVQLFNCFFYFALYLYLDSVVPSDNGIKDPIIKCKKRARNQVPSQELNSVVVEGNNDSPLIKNQVKMSGDNEDVSSAEFHENFYNPHNLKRAVFIDNLTKIFGKATAVNQVTMPIFEKQIFCLLGHNGAGKTTTINLMTGLLRPDGGNIFYDGEDFSENFETVRRKFGLCVQKDILYPTLTVGEHIELISRLRGVSKEEIPNYIAFLSNKVGLRNEIDKFANNLSGGNKRKLSLALAIAGDTKVIFLDEPTSGLDPNSRRNFWEIVRRLKEEGKTILLTTHNLDEADELADRIAILSKGKLLILGTSNFLKKKYGVGYNLIVTPKPDAVALDRFHNEKDKIIKCVKSLIHTSELDSKTSPEMVKMTLPYGESEKFAELFKVLENDQSIEIALEMNSLEDVFVNMGLQEEAAAEEEAGSIHSHNLGEIPIPDSLNQVSTYTFMGQVSAMFHRRLLNTIRNRTNIFQVVLPLIYVVLVTVITSTSSNNDQTQVYTFGITTMIGFLMNSVIYTGLPVMERELNIKYLLRTIGLRPLPYWLGTFLFDLITVSIYGVLILPIGYALGMKLVSSDPGDFFLTVFSLTFALVNLSYVLSWLYGKQATVYRFHILLLIFGFFYVPFFLFLFVVAIPSDPSTALIVAVLVVGVIISPPMVFLYASFNLVGLPFIKGFDKNYYFYLLMFGQGVFYFIINYLIELRSLRLSAKNPSNVQDQYFVDHIPNPHEISSEAERVTSSQNNDPIRTRELTKIYDNGFQALRGVTFGVERGQIFGLLGPNGAGKSTTFGILSGLIPKTSGQVEFGGQDLNKLDPALFQQAGICPQFDALWEHLTVKEHFEVIGKLKGLDKLAVQDAMSYYTQVLRMQEHLNKKANQLSGGTKRKLCVANMLIGSPVIQFLDEPSTGLDPLSKRSLYDTIIRNLHDRNASVILTTHSMSEAEALCSKIGILINGKFVCMGTLPYLKSRYGTGYKISVVKDKSNPHIYQKAILEAFPTATKENDNSEIYESFRILEFSFEKAFVVMEQLKKSGHVSDFNIMNTTLEQVFIGFSRNQAQALELQTS